MNFSISGFNFHFLFHSSDLWVEAIYRNKSPELATTFTKYGVTQFIRITSVTRQTQ